MAKSNAAVTATKPEPATKPERATKPEPATKPERAKGLGKSPRAAAKAKKSAPADADKAESDRLRRNAYTRAWRARKKEAAEGAPEAKDGPKAPEAPAKAKPERPPYPDTVAAPPPGMQPSVVLSLPIAPGAKATPAQVLSTLELAVASYRAQLRNVPPSAYARVEGAVAGLEMARALVALLGNRP